VYGISQVNGKGWNWGILRLASNDGDQEAPIYHSQLLYYGGLRITSAARTGGKLTGCRVVILLGFSVGFAHVIVTIIV
jgi:hypothetical protein